MIWWAIVYLPNWPIDIFKHDNQTDARAQVVVEHHRRKKIVTHLNETAQHAGIQVGMSLADAQALSPGTEHHTRDIDAERQALLNFAKQWRHLTPHIVLYDSQSLLLNMTTCIRLWGGLHQSIKKTITQADQFTYDTQVIWAPTPMAAYFFARSGAVSGYYALNELDTLNIRHLPADAHLPQLSSWVQKLDKMGIRTFAQLTRIATHTLAQYFNQAFVTYLNKLLGKHPDPRPSIEFEILFSKQIDLEFPIKNKQALLFPIKTLLVEFEQCMRAQQKSALAFSLNVQDEHHKWHTLNITLAEAEHRQSKIQPLVILKLEQLEIQTGIIGVKLSCTHWVNYWPDTPDFWGVSTQSSDAGRTLLNRLYTRLGQQNVQSLQPVPDHRPEHAWRAYTPNTPYPTEPVNSAPRRPNWLLPQPKALNHSEQTPNYQGPLKIIYGPERIESGWWDTHPVARDYFIARHPQGYEYWIFKPLLSDALTNQSHCWYLHGVFS